MPKYEDNEATIDELKGRIDKTVAFLKSIKPDRIDDTDEKIIQLKVGGRDLEFKGLDYLLYFVNPNVYFHITTAYDILRHCGVEVGKMDFLGKP